MKKLDAVLIQPTYTCALNCTGCYVKESKQGKPMSIHLFKQVMDYLNYNGVGKYDIGHLTLALDNLPTDYMDANIMKEAFLWYLWGIDEKKTTAKLPRLHITANSPDVLTNYLQQMGLRWNQLPERLELISFSHIDMDNPNHAMALGYLTGLKKKINYNFMPMGQPLDNLKKTLFYVEMSYIVLHKTGLGNKNDQARINYFKEALKEIDTWPEEYKKKIFVDHCVQDAFKFKKTGYGCSANVSKLHVWPDGHISGCPYNKDGGVPVNNITGFKDAMDKALDGTVYDFNKCTIPADYDRKPEDAKKSRFKSLQIIE